MPTKTAPEKKKPSKQKGSSSSRETSNKRKASETNTNKETKPTKKSKFSFSTGKPTDDNLLEKYLKLHQEAQMLKVRGVTNGNPYLHDQLEAFGIELSYLRSLPISQKLYLAYGTIHHFIARLKHIVDSDSINEGNDSEEIKKAVKIIINNLILPPQITHDVFPIEAATKAVKLVLKIKKCSKEDPLVLVKFCKDQNLKYEKFLEKNKPYINKHHEVLTERIKRSNRMFLARRTRHSDNTTSRSNRLFQPDGASSPSAGRNGAPSPCSQPGPSAGGSGS